MELPIPESPYEKKARTTPQKPNTPAKKKTPIKGATTQEKAKNKTPVKKGSSQEKVKKKTRVRKPTTQEKAKKKTLVKKSKKNVSFAPILPPPPPPTVQPTSEGLSSALAHREEVRGIEGPGSILCKLRTIDRYLGLPAMVGLDRTDSFVYLLERIIERLKGWKERFLSMGGVLRDSKGEIQGGFCRPMDNLLSAAMAEAKALHEGLAFLERFGCLSCQVEADALELIQACNGDVDINSPYAAILADCFQKAKEMEEITFLHCHREANQVAHELAKLAYINRENRVWEGDPPDVILPFVINDVTLFTTL
ncbi:hypothetical protein QYE76_017669 [Lolium multiflorum]|nr:hypothetical protein QYE76_017669 [Lolium multiflorum]